MVLALHRPLLRRPNAETFGALRFIAGLGLGGLVPNANALTAEFVSVRARSAIATSPAPAAAEVTGPT